MICFKGRTFCVNETCAKHGNGCDMAFTEAVREAAIKADLPVSLANIATMNCYVTKEAT